jgi:hypothetical protein
MSDGARRNVQTRIDGEWVYFDFFCLGCGAEGELGIPRSEGTNSFGCPEGCGATYVPWLHPLELRMQLECVVCPIFERPAI